MLYIFMGVTFGVMTALIIQWTHDIFKDDTNCKNDYYIHGPM